HARPKRDWSSDVCSSDLHVRRSGTGEISLSFIRCVASGQVFPRYCNCFGFDVVHGEGRKPGHWIPAASILTARPPFAAIHGHRGERESVVEGGAGAPRSA